MLHKNSEKQTSWQNFIQIALKRFPGIAQLLQQSRLIWRLSSFSLLKTRKVLSFHILYDFTLDKVTRTISLNPCDYRSYLISLHRQDHKLILLAKLCQQNNITTFIDIGANYGEFSTYLSEFVEQIISVEPNPLVIPYLQHTLLLSARESTLFRIIDRACVESDKISYSSFEVDSSYSGGCHILEKDKDFKHANLPHLFFGKKKMVKVKTISIKEIFNSINFTNKEDDSLLIKIDVEGYEHFILKGIENWLRNNPLMRTGILFEYNLNSFSNSEIIYSLLNDFLDLGFSIYSICGSPEIHDLRGISLITLCSDFDPRLDQEIFLVRDFETSFLSEKLTKKSDTMSGY